MRTPTFRLFTFARLFAFDANILKILKFIDGHRSRGCRGLPFESGNTLIHPCPLVWRNVYSLIHRDARRRLIYQIPKSRSSPRFPFSSKLERAETSSRDATLFSRCIGATVSYNEFTCDIATLGKLPILPVHYSTSCAQCC